MLNKSKQIAPMDHNGIEMFLNWKIENHRRFIKKRQYGYQNSRALKLQTSVLKKQIKSRIHFHEFYTEISKVQDLKSVKHEA